MTAGPLLEAIGVTKTFSARGRVLRAVDDVSLQLGRHETLGLVGESGCGKSTLGRCVLRLDTLTSGAVRFDGMDISTRSQRSLRPLRPRMQMVFQDPYGSLNPRRRVGDLVAEPLRIHRAPDGRRRDAASVRARVEALLELVGLRPDHAARYPHEFSGGQRQRIGIARALALHPALVVADEPVSALDVSVQAQVINLLMDLQDRLGLSYLFVAHDLAVIRQISDRVAVMYLGAIVETGPVLEVFQAPAHPYTAALLAAVPLVGGTGTSSPGLLHSDTANPPVSPGGCAYYPRCPRARARCREERPTLPLNPGAHSAACHFPLA